MSVTTGTSLVTRTNISDNKYFLTISLSSTGDGTGGNVVYSYYIDPYISTDTYTTLVDSILWNDDANTRIMSTILNTSDWESLSQGIVCGLPQGFVSAYTATPTTRFYSTHNSHTQKHPIYLGGRTGATCSLSVTCDTNTNGKTYQTSIRLLVENRKYPYPTYFIIPH